MLNHNNFEQECHFPGYHIQVFGGNNTAERHNL